MTEQLFVLIITHSEDDIRLYLQRLRAAGMNPVCQGVSDLASLQKELDQQVWDAVVCDYATPGLDVLAALTVVREKDPDLPFIIVSGVKLEDAAVDMMKAGANDFLMKDRLDRLAPAIEREIRKADYIRARRHAEDAARESEKRYREIFDHTADAIFTIDILPGGRFEYASFNPASEKILGIKISESYSKRPEDIFPSPVADIMNVSYQKCLESGEPIRRKEELNLPGGYVIVDMTLIPVKDEFGRTVRIVGVAHDITERTMMEFELNDSRKQLELAASAAHIGLWDWDLRSHKMYISPEWKRQLGYDPSEIPNEHRAWEQCIHPDDLDMVLSTMQDSFPIKSNPLVLEYRCRQKSGAYSWMMSQWSFLRDDRGTPYRVLGVDIDITGRKQREGNLLQSHKMEAIGKFASGISHDYSNILTIIMGFNDVALRQWESCQYEKIGEELREIKKAAKMGASLMAQLQAFCRTRDFRPERIMFTELIDLIKNMLQRLIGEDIRLVSELDPGLRAVTADRGQCEQVIMNLMVRAKEVMPDGGTVTIGARNVVLSEADVRGIPDARPGEYVRLSVSDTGRAMDKELIRHVFDPFSKEREPAQGPGFGMAVNFAIVRQNDGWMQVSSGAERGSTFSIFLPASREKVGEASPAVYTAVETAPAAGKRILLVEDEEVVRKLIARVLRDQKYVVFDVPTAEKALDIFHKEQGAFDLLFTDAVLPGINGVALAQQLVSSNHRLKVLISSGYLDDKSPVENIRGTGYRFLKKPCDQQELLAAVRESLVP